LLIQINSFLLQKNIAEEEGVAELESISGQERGVTKMIF
jgi:hypothetical protein